MFFVENLIDYRQENKNHFLSKDLKKKSVLTFSVVSEYFLSIKTIHL